MTVIHDIDALEYAIDADLNDTLAALSYRVPYSRLDASRVWDSTLFDSVALFKGQIDPDLIRVKATTEGFTDTLVLGVADRVGWSDEAGAVQGEVAGRDYLALVLDRYPSEPFTLQGAEVAADGTLTYHETFTSAMQRLCDEAGLSVLFDGVLDYRLGKSLPVTADRTFAEVMAELLRPLRFSEKHRVDCWMDGTTLHIASRDTQGRGTVTVAAKRLIVNRMDRVPLPAVSNIRIDGMSYELIEPDVPPTQTPGLPWSTPFTVSFGPYIVNQYVGTPPQLVSYQDEGTEWYNTRGQLTRSFQRRSYLTKPRIETTTREMEYVNDPLLASNGNKKTEHETYFVQDSSAGRTIQETVREKRLRWEYFADNGDTKAEYGWEIEKDETSRATPLPLMTGRSYKYLYRRSAGQIFREWEIVETDPATGETSRTFGTSEVGPVKVAAAQSVASFGMRTATRRVGAGPDEAGNIRRESSELLGHEDDCEAIRQDLLDEHTSEKIPASFSMAPDVRIRVGMTMTVQDAPAWWPATSFYITAVRVGAAHDGMEQTVEGIAWL